MSPLGILAERVTLVVNGCWLWTGPVMANGYGQVDLGGRHWLAHRLVWALLVGSSPEHLHHRCRVRRCVNPAHLEPLTAADHARAHRLESCKAGHPLIPENTYERRDGRGRQCRACKAARQRDRYARNPAAENAARIARRNRRS